MAIIDVTPIMTSNTTPSPYVISASSIYSKSYDCWMAFDNTATSTWCANHVTLQNPQWIKIDFGDITKLNKYVITTRDYAGAEEPPNDWVLEYSLDDINWNVLDEQKSQFIEVKPNHSLEFTVKNAYVRYLRLTITKTKNSAYFYIGELRFLYDDTIKDEQFTKISIHKTLKSNLPKTIPEGKTELHLTEDGGIHINDKNGRIKKMGPEKFLVDIERTLNGLNITYNDGTNKEIII